MIRSPFNSVACQLFWRLRTGVTVSNLFILSLICGGVRVTANQQQSDASQAVAELRSGNPIERRASSGDKHAFQLALTSGQFARVEVEQRGIDALIRVLGPDEELIAVFDGERWYRGRESVELVADSAGNYRLMVEIKGRKTADTSKPGTSGSYEIRLVETRLATDRDRALQQARALYAECNRLRAAGKLYEAIVTGQQLLQIRERELGPDHREVAVALNNLAGLYRGNGQYDKAESLGRRALAIWEKAGGHDHPEVATTLNGLGLMLHFDKGDYVSAEAAYRRALDIWSKALGREHPYIPAVLNNLAITLVARGEFDKAEPMYKEALSIQEALFGKESIDGARTLNNLAELYRQKSEYASAEPLYERALAQYERAHGSDSPEVADVLRNLGIVYSRRKEYAKAETNYRRALTIYGKSYGADSVEVALTLNNLAALHQYKGEYGEAESLYRRALSIYEKNLGTKHPDMIVMLNNLSSIYLLKGDVSESVAYLSRYLSLGDYHLELNLVTGSEKQKAAFASTLASQLDWVISVHARYAPENSQACELAATAVLQRKGRIQDSMADTLASLRRRSGNEDRAALERLSVTTSRLAALVLSGPDNLDAEAHGERIKRLEDERDKLESEVGRRSAGYYRSSRGNSLDAVRAAVPADAALLEFVVYRPFDPKTDTYDEPRYIAYVVRNKGPILWRDLGPAKPLDAAIDQLRQALRDPLRKDAGKLARAVDERLMQPIRPLLGDAIHLLISPDGAINLIPVEALVDEHSRYLVERYSFTYLTSGRDLLRLETARARGSAPVVLANPSFGEPASSLATRGGAAKPPGNRVNGRSTHRRLQSTITASDLSDIYFAPVAGTALEAEAITSFFPDARLLTRSQATESSLKQLVAPRILHIATHGFFLGERRGEPGAGRDPTRAISAAAKIENPLLRSGLALAGANQRRSGEEDGILTALEASGLDLWGTRLVTLSACDTGIGEVKTGEGVYGLRRAFVLAGTESMVMSLWPVSDSVTRELMIAYYRKIKEGVGRGKALHRTQLEMLQTRNRRHPFYWASFIQFGEWANLEGKR